MKIIFDTNTGKLVMYVDQPNDVRFAKDQVVDAKTITKQPIKNIEQVVIPAKAKPKKIKRTSRSSKRWTKREREYLQESLLRGRRTKGIAKDLGRTPEAVSMQIYLMKKKSMERVPKKIREMF